jgi:hypothetical protein
MRARPTLGSDTSAERPDHPAQALLGIGSTSEAEYHAAEGFAPSSPRERHE